MKVHVFISYHDTDFFIAEGLRKSLEKLSSNRIEVFLDKYSIGPGDRFEPKIAEAIKKAEWFLIVCTGSPQRDALMMWSFFEAGQFRATLKDTLVPEASKRIVCLYDTSLPEILAVFQGVKVGDLQRSNTPIDMLVDAHKNPQLDNSAIFDLLKRMMLNAPEEPLRDVNALSSLEMLREESHKLIQLFASVNSTDRVSEISLQPRISFELTESQTLNSDTVVTGYDGSLRHLFGIEANQTTWSEIVQFGQASQIGTPTWLSDIEAAATDIMLNRTPPNHGVKCVLKDKKIHRVIVSRYEVFKNRRRAIYIGFLPVSTQPFDLNNRSSSTLLSSLILSVRFREQVIPMAALINEAKGKPEKLNQVLDDFYRLLISVEMEARQFGLDVSPGVPANEAPLSAVIKDHKKRRFVQSSIDDWTTDRKNIEEMFAAKPANVGSNELIEASARQISDVLTKLHPVNLRFIEYIVAELLNHVREQGSMPSRKRGTTKKKSAQSSQAKRDVASGKGD